MFNALEEDCAALMEFGTVSTNAATLLRWPVQSTDPFWCCTEGALGVSCEQSRVTSLDLGQSGIRGSFYPSFGNLDALTTLNIQANEFQGNISALASLSRLTGM